MTCPAVEAKAEDTGGVADIDTVGETLGPDQEKEEDMEVAVHHQVTHSFT
jgi:hypothetical protein